MEKLLQLSLLAAPLKDLAVSLDGYMLLQLWQQQND
jgi:hypothetical protein